MTIDHNNRKILLDIAEKAILNQLDKFTGTNFDPLNLDSEIKVGAGAFVSVYIEGKLRGCIGTFSEDTALYENVRKMAVSAAFQDSRFKAIRAAETAKLGIEVSVLTPRKRISSEEEIEIGRHGIYIVSGMQRGTLLPQVAVKNSWSSLEFLEYCAQYKAGLHKDAWRSAELYTYEAIVFSSQDFPRPPTLPKC